MLQNEWLDGILWGSVGQEEKGPDRPVQREGLRGSTPPHCTAFITHHEYYPTTLPPALWVLYYGPACPDPFVPAS